MAGFETFGSDDNNDVRLRQVVKSGQCQRQFLAAFRAPVDRNRPKNVIRRALAARAR